MSILDYTFTVNRTSKIPIWQQVKQHLLECVQQGDLKAGQLIPNEKNLVSLFNVSTGTVRKAISELEKDGIFISRQGSGTIVATHNAQRFLYKYFHIVEKNATKKSLPFIKTISFKKRKATHFEAKQLDIHHQNVYEIYNLLSVQKGKKCNMLDKIMLPSALFASLNQEIFMSRKSTIYNLYQNKFNIFITHISERIEAIPAPKIIAKKLNISLNTPILKITRIGYTHHNQPIELRISYVLTNTIEYLIHHE